MTDNHTELCERLRQASIQCSDCGMYETSSDFDLAVSMIESQAARIKQQAARIAELEKERDALKAAAIERCASMVEVYLADHGIEQARECLPDAIRVLLPKEE